jgi:hypothetical protein
VWSACIVACLLGETEANWSAPAHVALMAIIGSWLAPQLPRGASGGKLPRAAWCCGAVWFLGLIGLTALQHTEWFYPVIAGVVPPPTAEQPVPLRLFDPTCRMRGFRELIPEIESRLADLRAKGEDPFVLTPTYVLASTFSFYMEGHPDVYCLAWSPGMAALALNQHDLWRPNPRRDLDVFRGRPVVIVEDASQAYSYTKGATDRGVVGSAEPSTRLIVRRGDAVVGAWLITVCHGYRGPQHVEEYRTLLRTYATPAYYAAQGGTPRGFVQGLYRDLLGRAPKPEEFTLWTNVMKIQPRSLVVTALADRENIVRKR